MFKIVLFEPEIPPNTGNVIRLCANTGCELHLVRPLGFPLDDAKMRRAGLDYREFASVRVHDDWQACRDNLHHTRMFAMTTKGKTCHHRVSYQAGDVFVFGPESRGLPGWLRETFAQTQQIRLPMCPGSRSLNLSNAVAITIFEAWRQLDFSGAHING